MFQVYQQTMTSPHSKASMKRVALGLVICATIALSGCAGTIINSGDAAKPTRRVGHTPEYLTLTATGVGETMYAEYDYLSLGWALARLKNDFHWSPLPGARVDIPAGEQLIAMVSGAFCTKENSYWSMGIGRKVCFGDENSDMRFEKMQIAGTLVGYSVDVPYEAGASGEHELVQAGGFRRELLYQGVAGGIIKLLYREYRDDFARPAFFQDVSYDYEPGMIVSFKGARFEVREANGEQTSFKVLNGFR